MSEPPATADNHPVPPKSPVWTDVLAAAGMVCGLWGLARAIGHAAGVAGWVVGVLSNLTIAGAFVWGLHEGVTTGGWRTAALLAGAVVGFVAASFGDPPPESTPRPEMPPPTPTDEPRP